MGLERVVDKLLILQQLVANEGRAINELTSDAIRSSTTEIKPQKTLMRHVQRVLQFEMPLIDEEFAGKG